jgi:riboflavin biosynthesis pyrimidine reductase
VLAPLEVLHDEGGPRYGLPPRLEQVYGELGFEQDAIYSNFVTSLDGVVTLGPTPSAGSVISGKNPADRFLMGLLRACADAVLLGAGTLRATPGHLWTPEHVSPDFAADFAELRRSLGRAAAPRLVVVTASGKIDVGHPAIVAGATVLTTREGAGRLRATLPHTCDLVEIGLGKALDVKRVVAEVRSRGHRVILTEGGPHLVGELTSNGLLDEAFITLSPVLAGRAAEPRLGMLAGVELLPNRGVWSRLMSARRQGDFLYLRYSLKT